MIQRSTCKGGTDRPMAAAPGTLTDYNGVSEALGRRRVRYVCRNVACQGLRRTGGSGAAGTVESVFSGCQLGKLALGAPSGPVGTNRRTIPSCASTRAPLGKGWLSYGAVLKLERSSAPGRAHPQDCPNARFSYDSLQSFGQLC